MYIISSIYFIWKILFSFLGKDFLPIRLIYLFYLNMFFFLFSSFPSWIILFMRFEVFQLEGHFLIWTHAACNFKVQPLIPFRIVTFCFEILIEPNFVFHFEFLQFLQRSTWLIFKFRNMIHLNSFSECHFFD